MKKSKFIIFMILLISAGQFSTTVHAAEKRWGELFTGHVYLAGTSKGLLLFRQENIIEQRGEYTFLKHSYMLPDGNPATVEEVTLKEGELVNYFVDFANSDCGCKLDRTGETVRFSFTRGDTSRTGVRDYEPTLITGPTLPDYVSRNWDNLMSGRKEYFHFPAMTLQRIVRFQLSRNDKSPYARDGVIVLKMDIANFFIRLFIEPVDLVYDLETRRLLEIHGKSLLEREVDGKKENPVVDIYYSYNR